MSTGLFEPAVSRWGLDEFFLNSETRSVAGSRPRGVPVEKGYAGGMVGESEHAGVSPAVSA